MGRLYDGCQQVLAHIDAEGLDIFRTRGAFAMKLGFILSLAQPDIPDDPEQIAKLKDAAEEILGIKLIL